MTKTDHIWYWLKALATPHCWLQNEHYSSVWNRELQELLGRHYFLNIEKHTATLGGVEIWTANHPYASFRPYGKLPDVRPSRRVILYACDKLIRESLDFQRRTGMQFSWREQSEDTSRFATSTQPMTFHVTTPPKALEF